MAETTRTPTEREGLLMQAEADMREAATWDDRPRSRETYMVSAVLLRIGWKSPCDAQWERLESALPLLREALRGSPQETDREPDVPEALSAHQRAQEALSRAWDRHTPECRLRNALTAPRMECHPDCPVGGDHHGD